MDFTRNVYSAWRTKSWTEAVCALVFASLFLYCMLDHWCIGGHLEHHPSLWERVSDFTWAIASVLLGDFYRRRESVRVRWALVILLGWILSAFWFSMLIYKTPLSKWLGDFWTGHLFLLFFLTAGLGILFLIGVGIRKVFSKPDPAEVHFPPSPDRV